MVKTPPASSSPSATQASPALDLFGSAPLTAPVRRPVAFRGLPVGHPMREREMVCALTGDLGRCPRSTSALGPVDVCRQRIGTIGYQLGGVVICWSCFVRAMASERAAKEAALKGELAEVGGVSPKTLLAGGAGEADGASRRKGLRR